MDSQFWIKAWKEGRTHFHRDQYHEMLLKYFPALGPRSGQRILVPLCGKTKDMAWLKEKGLIVHGLELYSGAVEEFFTENNMIPYVKDQGPEFTNYTFENLLISCGDFFLLSNPEAYDYVYDRASLVALPQSLRKRYADEVKQSIKKNGKYFLIVCEYDQGLRDGPPFSISRSEVERLYAPDFDIQLLDDRDPSQITYLLTKK